MSSVEKVSNVLGGRKEEMVTKPFLEKKEPTKDVDKGTGELVDTPLLENKSSTNNVDKGNDELTYMKKAVLFQKPQLKFLINPVQRKNANRYYMLLEVVGMSTN